VKHVGMEENDLRCAGPPCSTEHVGDEGAGSSRLFSERRPQTAAPELSRPPSQRVSRFHRTTTGLRHALFPAGWMPLGCISNHYGCRLSGLPNFEFDESPPGSYTPSRFALPANPVRGDGFGFSADRLSILLRFRPVPPLRRVWIHPGGTGKCAVCSRTAWKDRRKPDKGAEARNRTSGGSERVRNWRRPIYGGM